MKGLATAIHPFKRLDRANSMGSAQEFLLVNTTNLACMHPNIGVPDTDILCLDIAAGQELLFMTGTPSDPVGVQGRAISPHTPLVIVFNRRAINDMLLSNTREAAEYKLWATLLRALRMWHLNFDLVSLSDLVPTAALGEHGFTEERDQLMEYYTMSTWSGAYTKIIFDSMFVTSAIGRIIQNCYRDGFALPVQRMGDLLFKLDRTTYLNLMPSPLGD